MYSDKQLKFDKKQATFIIKSKNKKNEKRIIILNKILFGNVHQ